MNINEELEKFNKEGFEAIQKELETQQEDLRKKQYLFKVLNNMNQLQDAINNGFFEKNDAQYVHFEQSYDHDYGEVLTEFYFLDSNKRQKTKYNGGNYTEEVEFITKILHYYNFVLDDGLFNNDIIKQEFILKMDDNLVPTLKKLLLNEELYKAVNYIEMLNKIPEKHSTKTSKKKI